MPQPHGRDDLQETPKNGPVGDDQEKRQLGDSRPSQGEQSGGNAHEPYQDEGPPRLVGLSRLERMAQRQDAVDEGPEPDQEHQRHKGHRGLHQRNDPDEDGDHAAQDERPPVSGK